MNSALLSSKTVEWETPLAFYSQLNDEFNFTLDPCATEENHKCKRFYTKKQDGLSQSWENEVVFCNPPYGREIYKWVKKASEESRNNNALVVMLIPARTDTKWFHEYIYNKIDIRFLPGRLKFGNAINPAPFPCMICIFRPQKEG